MIGQDVVRQIVRSDQFYRDTGVLTDRLKASFAVVGHLIGSSPKTIDYFIYGFRTRGIVRV